MWCFAVGGGPVGGSSGEGVDDRPELHTGLEEFGLGVAARDDPRTGVRDDLVACPDPEERLIMRVVRTGIRSIPTDELT